MSTRLHQLLARVAAEGGNVEQCADAILDSACASGISQEEAAEAMTAALEAYGVIPPIAPGVRPVVRVPRSILFCQAPYEEFIFYVNTLDTWRLNALDRGDYSALRDLMDDLTRRGGAWMKERYRQRQEKEYQSQEAQFIEAAIARGYVVMDDQDGLSVRHDYTSDTVLLFVCRRFVSCASRRRIGTLLDQIAA